MSPGDVFSKVLLCSSWLFVDVELAVPFFSEGLGPQEHISATQHIVFEALSWTHLRSQDVEYSPAFDMLGFAWIREC